MGWKILRGSSSRGGSRIFIEIVKILRQPSTLIGITPDGPRGPEKIPKAGVIKAAQKLAPLLYLFHQFLQKIGNLLTGILFS